MTVGVRVPHEVVSRLDSLTRGPIKRGHVARVALIAGLRIVEENPELLLEDDGPGSSDELAAVSARPKQKK